MTDPAIWLRVPMIDVLYQGLSLREMIHEFKYQTLVLFKALLLQPKVSACPTQWPTSHTNVTQMLFFGSRCERLCMIQFSLVSLIPGLLNKLQDCADPAFDTYAQTVEQPTSLKTSDRNSCRSSDFFIFFSTTFILIVLQYWHIWAYLCRFSARFVKHHL